MKKKTKTVLYVLLAVFAIEYAIGLFLAKPQMEDVGKEPQRLAWIDGEIKILGPEDEYKFLAVNIPTVLNAVLVSIVLIAISLAISKGLKKVPSRGQRAMEMFVEMFDEICEQTLGDKARKYLPFVGTIFLFVLFSNWLGVIPSFWHVLAVKSVDGSVHTLLPEWLTIEEPTRDLNTTFFGLAVMCFFVAHISGIYYRGGKKYLAEYFEPKIGKIPNIPMFFINLVGEGGKAVSHGFRLFGNIFGGAIILSVGINIFLVFTSMQSIAMKSVGSLLGPVYLGATAFFGLFVGLIQAFVFAMLALTYTAVMVVEE